MESGSVLTTVVVVLAEVLVFAIPLALAAGWLVGHRVEALVAFVAVLTALAVSYGFGFVYQHPSPYQVTETVVTGEPENSFPSQHATALFAAAIASVWLRYYRVAALMGTFALLTAGARVYIGEHYPVDVAGAFFAAVVGVGLVTLAADPVRRVAHRIADLDDALRVRDR